MPGDIQAIIAQRLCDHSTRAGIPVSGLPARTDLSQAVIGGYFSGGREIKFDELRPICTALRLRLMELLCRSGPYELFDSDAEFATYEQRIRGEIEKMQAE